MKKIVVFLFTLAIATTAGAQSVSSLGINPDARSGGMGEAGVALKANQYSLYHNTAAIALSDLDGAVGYSFNWRTSSILKNNNLHTVSGFYKINCKHAIAAGFRYFSTPKMDLMPGGGTFKPKDYAIDLAYAYAITDYLGVAANVRYIRSEIAPEGKDNAFAGDLSLYFQKNRWSAGLALSNVGSKLDFGGADKYNMPAWVKLGGAREFILGERHMLTASLEGAYMFKPSDFDGFQGGVGLEYMYNNLLAIRGGYHLAQKEKTGHSYGTVGLGVNLWGFMIEGAYVIGGSDNPVKNSVRLSLGYRF